MAVAESPALVSGGYRVQPDDLRERRHALGAHTFGAAHEAVDLPARPARFGRAVYLHRRPRLLASGDRLARLASALFEKREDAVGIGQFADGPRCPERFIPECAHSLHVRADVSVGMLDR